jgi:hypothetical protein
MIYQRDDNESITNISGFHSCFGYIGDYISRLLYGSSELDPEWKEDINDGNFIIGITINASDKIREAIDRMNINWKLNITEITQCDGILFIEIPKSTLLETKWKVQGMMQIIRYLHYPHTLRQGGLLFGEYKQYGDITDSKLGILYSLTFVPIPTNEKLSFIDETDKVYHGKRMIHYSHDIGVIELIPTIYKILKDEFENKK